MHKFSFLVLYLLSAISVSFSEGEKFVELRDFRKQEVKSAGFTLSEDRTVHINALGGAGKTGGVSIGITFGETKGMYAYGWIIDAKTRNVVWEMTTKNTSGKYDRCKFDDDIELKKGSYEVYYAAVGYARESWFSHIWINIDRRTDSEKGLHHGDNFFDFFDHEDISDEFMERAKEYGITLSAANISGIENFESPVKNDMAIVSLIRAGDDASLKKSFTLSIDMPVRISAIGESMSNDEMDDYGWIINSDTRQQVWRLERENSKRGGGGKKNVKFDGTVKLQKGNYEMFFITDGSHSCDDWNAQPPYDPFNYGITLSVYNESDKNFIIVHDSLPKEKKTIVSLIHPRNDDFLSAGFTLNEEAKLRIYVIGERDYAENMADCGWIINAKTRVTVWEIEDVGNKTSHAGGAEKNRMVNEVITLPKGNYIAYYQTDGSHTYNDWNSSPPFDKEYYGLTIFSTDEFFDPSSVSSFKEGDEENVLAQIIRVRDHQYIEKSFTLDRAMTVRIYALGESEDHHLADYGWIESMETGETVWEMTYKKTERAGGAKKNRKVITKIQLQKGEYKLHYESDGSHSFDGWNDDPPNDRSHWGITVYQDEE